MEATEERSSTCQCGVGGGGRGHTLPQKEEVLVLSPPTPHICPERVLLLLSTEKVCKTKAKTQILGGGGDCGAEEFPRAPLRQGRDRQWVEEWGGWEEEESTPALHRPGRGPG